MTHRPGILAITIDCHHANNNGLTVRLNSRHANTPEWDYKNVVAWWCVSNRPMSWRLPDGKEIIASAGPIPERNLFPIDGEKPPQGYNQTPLTAHSTHQASIPRFLLRTKDEGQQERVLV